MLSLAERHRDRAQRRANNEAESVAGDVARGGLGDLVIAAQDVTRRVHGLSEADRAEFGQLMDSFDPRGEASLAEREGGSLTMAGIGLPNPFVVPPAALNELAADNAASGWGEQPAPTFDPANGNVNGAAQVDAPTDKTVQPGNGSGWGTPGATGGEGGGEGQTREYEAVDAGMKVAEIERIAATDGVDLVGCNNNAERVTRINEFRANADNA